MNTPFTTKEKILAILNEPVPPDNKPRLEDRLNDLFTHALQEERETKAREVEGLNKALPDHPCGEALCPHYPRTEGWNDAIDRAITIINPKT